MVRIIKLNTIGEVDEVNLSLKKNEKFTLSTIKKELLIDSKYFKEQCEWELENEKILKIFGSINENDGDENFHELPIKETYQFYGDLYAIVLSKNIILDLDIENFENIYNALYCESDAEESENEEVDDEILKWAISSEKSGELYKIIPQELEFRITPSISFFLQFQLDMFPIFPIRKLQA